MPGLSIDRLPTPFLINRLATPRGIRFHVQGNTPKNSFQKDTLPPTNMEVHRLSLATRRERPGKGDKDKDTASGWITLEYTFRAGTFFQGNPINQEALALVRSLLKEDLFPLSGTQYLGFKIPHCCN